MAVIISGKILLIIGFISLVCALKLPPNSVQLCSSVDPNLSQCFLKQSRRFLQTFCDGIPSLGTKPLDPMHIDKIIMNAQGLNLVMENVTMTGLKQANIHKFDINLKEKIGFINYNTDLVLSGKYDLRGEILKLPITGQGDFTITIKYMLLNVKLILKFPNGKDGNPHIKIDKYDVDYVIRDNAHFDFKNLFNGRNDQLAEATLLALNSQWSDVINEIGPPVIQQIIKDIINIIGKLLENVSYADLFSDRPRP